MDLSYWTVDITGRLQMHSYREVISCKDGVVPAEEEVADDELLVEGRDELEVFEQLQLDQYERAMTTDDDTPPAPLAEVLQGMRQLPVGELVRYEAMRKFPDDLAAELADMLANALQRGARDIVDHALAAMERQFGEDSDDQPGSPPND